MVGDIRSRLVLLVWSDSQQRAYIYPAQLTPEWLVHNSTTSVIAFPLFEGSTIACSWQLEEMFLKWSLVLVEQHFWWSMLVCKRRGCPTQFPAKTTEPTQSSRVIWEVRNFVQDVSPSNNTCTNHQPLAPEKGNQKESCLNTIGLHHGFKETVATMVANQLDSPTSVLRWWFPLVPISSGSPGARWSSRDAESASGVEELQLREREGAQAGNFEERMPTVSGRSKSPAGSRGSPWLLLGSIVPIFACWGLVGSPSTLLLKFDFGSPSNVKVQRHHLGGKNQRTATHVLAPLGETFC